VCWFPVLAMCCVVTANSLVDSTCIHCELLVHSVTSAIDLRYFRHCDNFAVNESWTGCICVRNISFMNNSIVLSSLSCMKQHMWQKWNHTVMKAGSRTRLPVSFITGHFIHCTSVPPYCQEIAELYNSCILKWFITHFEIGYVNL